MDVSMTIDESQAQSLSYTGLSLPRLIFTHGQFCVTVLRVKAKNEMNSLILY